MKKGAMATRCALRAEDWARTHNLGALKAAADAVLAGLRRDGSRTDAIAKFLAAGSGHARHRWLSRAAIASADRGTAPPRQPGAQPIELERSIIVKAPAPGERGLLFVSFETELARLLTARDFARLEQSYLICFMPTWQPAYSNELYQLAARATLPYVVMPAAREDLQLADELGSLCIALPLQAASWIQEDQFQVAAHKDIDIVLLANFSKYKRHWKLFEGLSQSRRRYRVVCAGRPWGGRNRATLEAEAAAFGVEQSVQFVENPSNEEVSSLLARARLFCAMSHKEGSFVAVAEALVAGTPVGMFEDAVIGTKSFINPQTGFLFSPRQALGPQLDAALERAAQMQPRTWACDNITASASRRIFNEGMRAWHERAGAPWTHGMSEVFCRNFAFGYGSAADSERFRPLYAQLLAEHEVRMKILPTPAAGG